MDVYQLQVDVLRSWVGDLVGQNTLLARAVEELENEATTKLIIERRRNTEVSGSYGACNVDPGNTHFVLNG